MSASIHGVGAVAFLLVVLTGCRSNCQTLAERVCSDLGPADCSVWREHDGPTALLPTAGRRGNNAVCGVLLDQYPKVLEGQRQVVASYKAADKASKR